MMAARKRLHQALSIFDNCRSQSRCIIGRYQKSGPVVLHILTQSSYVRSDHRSLIAECSGNHTALSGALVGENANITDGKEMCRIRFDHISEMTLHCTAQIQLPDQSLILCYTYTDPDSQANIRDRGVMMGMAFSSNIKPVVRWSKKSSPGCPGRKLFDVKVLVRGWKPDAALI